MARISAESAGLGSSLSRRRHSAGFGASAPASARHHVARLERLLILAAVQVRQRSNDDGESPILMIAVGLVLPLSAASWAIVSRPISSVCEREITRMRPEF